MWKLVWFTNTLKQIYIASQLTVINFLILTLCILSIKKKSIAFSQGLHIKRLCSSNVAFKNHLESLKRWFQNRGYLKTLVDNQLKHVTETRQTSDQTYKRGNGVPLVLAHHPRLNNANDIIKKHLAFLYAKVQVQNIFISPPFHFAQVLVLERIWLWLKYTPFYVNVDHLVVTKVDVKLV